MSRVEVYEASTRDIGDGSGIGSGRGGLGLVRCADDRRGAGVRQRGRDGEKRSTWHGLCLPGWGFGVGPAEAGPTGFDGTVRRMWVFHTRRTDVAMLRVTRCGDNRTLTLVTRRSTKPLSSPLLSRPTDSRFPGAGAAARGRWGMNGETGGE
ncbi:hypothetical protein GCM10022275_10010 [Tessaracoccus defluvii]